MQASPTASSSPPPGLARVLRLPELVIYGIILIQPTAPMPLFGVVAQKAHGHVVTTILIGMVAMLFTAISYGRMARVYPQAGSAYTYVGRALHPALGYLTGWGMLFDYVMNPIICVIWCSKGMLKLQPILFDFLPALPFQLWVVFFAGLFTWLNLRGIKASARTNQWVAGGLGVVIVLFFVAVVRHLWQAPALTLESFSRPFYDAREYSWDLVSSGTALAVLTYIGFDGISTLSEEAHNPRRNILLATVLTCLITGVLASLQVYAAQLVWPDFRDFPDADTAFVDVAQRAGGMILKVIVNVALVVATIGSGMGSHLGASRLLYGMGRDNAIPRRFFGAVHPRTQVPRNNILLVGAIALVGGLTMSYGFGAELLNFGAFIAFMGVNLAAFVHYYVGGQERGASYLVLPLLGFAICCYIWLNLLPLAKVVGCVWLGLGVVYGVWRTGMFSRPIEFAEAGEKE